jgi:hypothetical protein
MAGSARSGSGRRHVDAGVELLRREHAAVPRNQRALFVNEYRDGEAKFADRGSDLRHLFGGMSARVAGIGNQPIDRPALDLVCRPLARALARG